MLRLIKKKFQEVKNDDKKLARILSVAMVFVLALIIIPTTYFGYVFAQKNYFLDWGYTYGYYQYGYGYSSELPRQICTLGCTADSMNSAYCSWNASLYAEDGTPLDNFYKYELYYSHLPDVNRYTGTLGATVLDRNTPYANIYNLAHSTRYYFAVYVVDDNMNYSLLCNVASVVTQTTNPGGGLIYGSGGPRTSGANTVGASSIVGDPIPGPPLPGGVQWGELVKAANIDTVYFIDNDNRRHAFPNQDVYFSWFPDFSRVRVIADYTLAAIPLGSNVTMRPGTWMVKIQTDPKVYAVEPYGVLRWIQNESLAAQLYGLGWAGKVRDVNVAFWTNYQFGSDITAASHPTGSLVQYMGTASDYYIENGLRREISPSTFNDNLFRREFVNTIPASMSYPIGVPFPSTPLEYLMTLR